MIDYLDLILLHQSYSNQIYKIAIILKMLFVNPFNYKSKFLKNPF